MDGLWNGVEHWVTYPTLALVYILYTLALVYILHTLTLVYILYTLA